MNPNSSYEVLYVGLSDADRERLKNDVTASLVKGADEVKGILTKEVEKSVTALYSQLICNPWPTFVQDNGGSYEFIEAIRGSIWKAMLSASPALTSKYQVRDLIEAWQKNHPAEFKAAVGEETSRQINTLTEQLEFQNRRSSNSF